MSNNDLQKWVTSDVDFYALLGLTLTAPSSSELRRAYRKTALQYHPDKAGKDYDAEKYELFQAANGVLSDPELKAKYDGHRNAKLQRQRANELFEGKRRAMKEDLEERERGGAGSKRGREESEMDREMKKLAEEGRKRRAKRQSMMAENVASSPAPAPAPAPAQRKPEPAQTRGTTTPTPEMAPAGTHRDPVLVDGEEDAVESLERRIREAEAAKAKRKADKRARKSGVFVSLDSPAEEKPEGRAGMGLGRDETATATPIKRPDIFRGLKADEQSSASPKFSFSPTIPTPKRNDFAATMARLKAAEKQRLEDEIRKQESEAA
ncbi:related to pre-mRNA-splicing factor cwc23 [Rhynchosporium agropyri]|uniref:Related to pre-mRNA-splicing factor cwc23 n=1 Tax=Rhynchosporium agropyri TaxID=914238 RepID=A0A1E1KFP9_9HELO|nr:related to pre-mRNA-splicing factor cwc23 [Rhynchosporium agropyri]